jgi:hypothetical protein
MRAMEIIWEIFFCSFSSLFRFFSVKRTDGVSGRPDGTAVCPDGYSGLRLCIFGSPYCLGCVFLML